MTSLGVTEAIHVKGGINQTRSAAPPFRSTLQPATDASGLEKNP